MNAVDEVIAAAEDRAAALATGDAQRLTNLLHEAFVWTTHTGQRLSRNDYVRRNTGGHTVWRSQELQGVEVVVIDETGVLCAEVVDVVAAADGDEAFRMPVTQVWVRRDGRWQCLAGHAGPRRR